MEYVFGTVRRRGVDVENVKTVGEDHTELEGRISIFREYLDRTVEDTFTVTDHYGSGKDEEGNCYDWYLIKDHSRDTDRFIPAKPELEVFEAKADRAKAVQDYNIMMGILEDPEGEEE